MRVRSTGATLLACLLTWGCSEVASTNPYDPRTPSDQQAASSVEGVLELPEGYEASLFARFRVGLRPLAEGAVVEAEVAETGRFVFDPVTAGAYQLSFTTPGFVPPDRAFQVEIGQPFDLGTLPLEPLSADESGWVRGVVRLAGAPDGQHGGSTVEAVGTPISARTTSDGRFELALPTARYDLRFLHPGYTEQVREGVEVFAGEAVGLPEPIVLQGAPGRVRGRLTLEPGFEDAERLRAATVALFAPDGEEAAFDGGPSDDDGRFLLDGVPAGTWRQVAVADGTHPETRFVELGVGRDVDLGTIELRGLPTDGRLQGRATLLGAGPTGHAEIRVEVEGAHFTTSTRSDGTWALDVPARDGGYSLRFSYPGYASQSVDTEAVRPERATAVPDVTLVGQPGRVIGQIRLPEGVDPDKMQEVVLTVTDVAGAGEPRVGTPAADGRFDFEVPPSSYAVEVALGGFLPRSAAADVAPGEVENVGVVRLVPDLGSDRATFISGAARLDCGAEDCDHGGIRVEAAGWPFVTQTNRTGEFLLEVVEDTFELRFTFAGNREQVVRGVRVQAGETVVLPEESPVLLPFVPGSIVGRAERVAFDGGRLPAATATVSASIGDGDPVAAPLDPEGRFGLQDLRAGLYTLRVDLDRHLPVVRAVQVIPGGRVDLGALTLEPPRGGLGGRVAPSAPGTLVVVRGAADDDLTTGIEVVTLPAGEGAWSTDGLPHGRYLVTATAPGHRPPADVPAEVSADEAEPILLQPAPWTHALLLEPLAG